MAGIATVKCENDLHPIATVQRALSMKYSISQNSKSQFYLIAEAVIIENTQNVEGNVCIHPQCGAHYEGRVACDVVLPGFKFILC